MTLPIVLAFGDALKSSASIRDGGVEVLKQIMAIDPRALVVMLTSLNAIDVVKECIGSGAWNYILKNTTAEELHKAISATWGDYMAAIGTRTTS